jgi:hypothetical protein
VKVGVRDLQNKNGRQISWCVEEGGQAKKTKKQEIAQGQAGKRSKEGRHISNHAS